MRIFLFLLLFFNSFVWAQEGNKFLINNDYLVQFPESVKYIRTDENSGAFLFHDKQNSNIQVSVRPSQNMEFYKEGLSQTELLEAFYKWDFDFWKGNTINAKVTEISKKLSEGYVLWSIELDYESQKINQIILSGVKENNVVFISIINPKMKMNEKKKSSMPPKKKLKLFFQRPRKLQTAQLKISIKLLLVQGLAKHLKRKEILFAIP